MSACVHPGVRSVNLKTWGFPGGGAGNHSEKSKAFPIAQPVDLLNFGILQHFPAVWPPVWRSVWIADLGVIFSIYRFPA